MSKHFEKTFSYTILVAFASVHTRVHCSQVQDKIKANFK